MEELGTSHIYVNIFLKFNSYFAVYKASSGDEGYFGGLVSYDINFKTSGNFQIKGFQV